MINTIFIFLTRILLWLVMQILNLVMSAFPDIEFDFMLSIISTFFGFCQKGINLLYFISGPPVFTFITIWSTLWTIKHVLLPIINFTRKAIADLF